MKTEGAVEMVRYGYNESTRCLNFVVTFYHDLEGAQEAVRVIDAYNDFEAMTVNAALDALTQYMPPWGARIKVGREGSPVLYIDIDGEQDHPAVRAILRHAHAAEIDFTGNTVRAWWD